GPRVLPGNYLVKLTVNGKTLTAPLEVKLDPRVKIAAWALVQQNELERKLAELVTRSSQAVMQAQSVIDQLNKLAIKQDSLKASAQAAIAKETPLASGQKPPPAKGTAEKPPTLGSVNGKLVTLYKLIEVDAAPTAIQLAEA